jgi:hypothetical protein
MMGLGFKGLLLFLAVILFIVSALTSADKWDDFVSWGLAVFAAAFVVDSLPLGSMGPRRSDRA